MQHSLCDNFKHESKLMAIGLAFLDQHSLLPESKLTIFDGVVRSFFISVARECIYSRNGKKEILYFFLLLFFCHTRMITTNKKKVGGGESSENCYIILTYLYVPSPEHNRRKKQLLQWGASRFLFVLQWKTFYYAYIRNVMNRKRYWECVWVFHHT